MLLSKIMPSPQLSDLIREYRIVDFNFPADIALPSKAYPPRPEHCLQFFPRDMEQVTYSNKSRISSKRTSIIGQHTTVNTRHVGREFLSFQVVFKPGALFRITGMPSSELSNKYIDAEDILIGTQEVNEKLYNAKCYEQMVFVVEAYLIKLKKNIKKEPHRVDNISTLMQQMADVPLDNFIKHSYLCHRQFDRKFKERVGVSPKQYLQVIRFDRAFRMKNRHPEKDWLSIALHCGYYDYQHLVRDYKLFTGCTPNEFAAIEMKAPERAFGDIEV